MNVLNQSTTSSNEERLSIDVKMSDVYYTVDDNLLTQDILTDEEIVSTLINSTTSNEDH